MSMLGKAARDKVTGFDGIIVGKCDYLFGCTQLGIAPQSKDGKLESTQWFDDGRVEVTGPGVAPEAVAGSSNGGPSRDAPR
jgi:hypothetical protein